MVKTQEYSDGENMENFSKEIYTTFILFIILIGFVVFGWYGKNMQDSNDNQIKNISEENMKWLTGGDYNFSEFDDYKIYDGDEKELGRYDKIRESCDICIYNGI